MFKEIMVGLFALFLTFAGSTVVAQATCSTLPYTLTNGTTADATQVMANYNYLLNCVNTLPASVVQQSLSTNQSVTHATWTTVIFNVHTLDTQSAYNASNGHYTPSQTGKYLFCTGLAAAAATSVTFVTGLIAKNGNVGSGGANLAQFAAVGIPSATYSATSSVCTITAMNGSTDWVEVDVYVNGVGGSDSVSASTGGGGNSWFSGTYLGQ